MDYYATLGLQDTASDAEIKKAYRKLAMQYHPDKNLGDTSADEKFKKIADSYAILGDPEKRKVYDDSKKKKARAQNFGGFGFDEFVRSAEFKNSQEHHNTRARSSQGKTHAAPPNTDHLDITIKTSIKLEEALGSKKVEVSFKRTKVAYRGQVGDFLNYKKEEEEKEISIQLDLKKIYLAISRESEKYSTKVRISKLGNEDVYTRNNIWGDLEQVPLFGNLYIIIVIDVPENIEISGNNLIHKVELPLIAVFKKGEKYKLETLIGKKYELEINEPRHLTDLKYILPGEGILNENQQLGEYIIKFNILTPNLSKLNKSEKSQLLSLLENI